MNANRLTVGALLAVALVLPTTAMAETIEYRCNDSTTTHFIEYSADGKTATLQSDFGNLARKGHVLKAIAGAKGVEYQDDRTDMGKATLKGESKTTVTLAGGRRIFTCKALSK